MADPRHQLTAGPQEDVVGARGHLPNTAPSSLATVVASKSTS